MLSVAINSFSYTEKAILRDICFELEKGHHLAVLGESGSGKSTLLHIVYGLLHLEDGHIHWKDKKLLGPSHNLIPGESFMKLVAQEFDLMPFITVSENIATHLSRMDQKKDDERVEELLEVVDLAAFKNTRAKNLSGGQKQRVALAKALANAPELLLLDEPFSNIDIFRKNKLRRKLFQYLKDNQISCITATHDSEEALAFSDRILILKNGSVELFGTSEEVYSAISTSFQAGFFGEVNVLSASLFASQDSSSRSLIQASTKEPEIILFPHQLKVSEGKTKLKVAVEQCYFKGSHYLIQCRFNDLKLYFNHSTELNHNQIIYLDRKSI